jgi:hypothetical protein
MKLQTWLRHTKVLAGKVDDGRNGKLAGANGIEVEQCTGVPRESFDSRPMATLGTTVDGSEREFLGIVCELHVATVSHRCDTTNHQRSNHSDAIKRLA